MWFFPSKKRLYVFRYFSPSDLYFNFENIFFNAGIWEYIEELREFVIDLDSRVEKAQINATQINKLMKGDAKPVFTRYDDGRPAENLFNKEGKDYYWQFQGTIDEFRGLNEFCL